MTKGLAITGQSLALGGGEVNGIRAVEEPLYPLNIFMQGERPVGLSSAELEQEVNSLKEDEAHTIGHSMSRGIFDVDNVDIVVHGQAWGGANYEELKKGGTLGVYEKIINQTGFLNGNISELEYRGICCIHGEADGNQDNDNYLADLLEWKNDFNSDLKAITGQTRDIPFFFCQCNSACGYGNVGGILSTDFPTAIIQERTHRNYTDMVLVAPKYQLPYRDHTHITNDGERILGEYYAMAINHYEKFGFYNPLRPVAVIGSTGDNKVTVKYTGIVNGLSFDVNNVKYVANYGFEYYDLEGNTISKVEIDGNDVVITLSGDIGSGAKLAYAFQNGEYEEDGVSQENGRGERGNLRDNNNVFSKYTDRQLYNWGVTFRVDVKPPGMRM